MYFFQYIIRAKVDWFFFTDAGYMSYTVIDMILCYLIVLNINLAVNMLDTDGNVVEMGEGIGKQLIKAGGMNGEAVKTPLNLVLGKKAGTEMPEISAIELIFSADSKDVSGVPLTSDTYLRCILNARIPEGISVDLKKLLEDMQEEDDQLYEE